MSKKMKAMMRQARKSKGRSIVRNASKGLEKKMISQSEKLFENPYLILPKYDDKATERSFKKIKSQINKLEKIKNDVNKLEKFSKKRNLSSAVAGTMLIHHSKKAPYLAAAKMDIGTIMYAQRGNASREDLISVQHFNDPVLRLIGIRDEAMKNNIHIYSWDDGFISTGESKAPHADFLKFIFKTLDLKYEDKIVSCSHLTNDIITNKDKHSQPYLHIYWESAKTTIGICKNCASHTDNTIFIITKYLIDREISKDFEINIIGEIIKTNEKSSDYETVFLDEYYAGKISDFQMIAKNMAQRETNIRESSERKLILNGISYEDNIEKFIEALKPHEHEKKALNFLINKYNQPVIVKDATPNSVMELFWDEHGLELLESIVEDKEIASDLFSLKETQSSIVKSAYDFHKRKKIIDSLPEYDNLPDLASYANKMSRIYRTYGKEKMLTELKNRPDSIKGQSIYYSFLLVIGKSKDLKWKFSKIETESGEFLKEYVENLLNCPPEKYHDSLQNLISASGLTEDLNSYKI